MPKLQKLNSAIQKALEPKPKPPDDPLKAFAVVAHAQTSLMAEIERSNDLRNEALMELLDNLLKKETSINIDVTDIGRIVSEEIAKIPPVVVNIPKREPVAYEATLRRNSRGDLAGARIEPVKVSDA